MKIQVIHPIINLLGGAEQTTKYLLRSLVNNGHDTTLYTITDSCIDIPDNVHHNKKKRFPFSTRLTSIYETNSLFNNIGDCDLVIVSSGNLCLPTLESKKKKKQIIIYAHSDFESELNFVNNPTKRKSWLYNAFIQKQIKKQINLITNPSFTYIANSLYTKHRIKKLFNVNSMVIYPPVTMKNISSDKNRDGIITVSRFGPEKNLTFNIDVIKKIPTVYKMYGNLNLHYQNAYLKKLKSISKDYEHIKCMENYPRKSIENALNLSKVYFQSSKETFGISVVEGILAGCIPIVPDHTANQETVPFQELRYPDGDHKTAREKIKLALAGDYDKYLPELHVHVKKFSENTFESNIIQHIDKYNTSQQT